ncbi:hypothetical protein KOW79_006707, partial [Hemibagrus wyckioides]
MTADDSAAGSSNTIYPQVKARKKKQTGKSSEGADTVYSELKQNTDKEKPKLEITSSLKGAVLTGNSVTLKCTLKPQSAGWLFYWIKPTPNNWTETESDSYTISSVSVSDGEKPKPELTSSLKGAALTGNSVTLSCTLKPQSAGWKFYWSIPTQSSETESFSYTISSVSVSDGENPKPELTSDLKGDVLTGTSSAGWKFYWIKPTQSTNTSETETETHHYFISSVRVSDGGQYRCRAGRGNPVYYTHYSDVLWVNVTGESPPVSLIISPSRTQHFTADSLSLSCEDQSDSTGWTVRRYTHSETLFNCSSVSGSTCNISSLSTSHTGVYWCQSESGGRSNSVNITVHNGAVILDSPVHPVTEGHPLTLRCLYRSKMIPGSGVDFYKDDSILQNQTTGEMTISSVSKSDEGFYHCKHPERGESPKSWVSVRDRPCSTSNSVAFITTNSELSNVAVLTTSVSTAWSLVLITLNSLTSV